MELAVISNHGEANSGPFDPKLNVLTGSIKKLVKDQNVFFYDFACIQAPTCYEYT